MTAHDLDSALMLIDGYCAVIDRAYSNADALLRAFLDELTNVLVGSIHVLNQVRPLFGSQL